MIKARAGNVVLLGLSRINVTRLMDDKPIRFDGAEVGLPGVVVIIMGGETEQAMEAELRRHGAIGPNTVIDDRWHATRGNGDH